MSPSAEEEQFRQTVDLKDRALAAFLAWLIPGLGHLYQGRTAKATLFFVCILGTFVYGVYLGSDAELGWARVVYMSWREGDKRLPYICQVGTGLPALPAVVQAIRASKGRQVWWNGFMAPPPLAGKKAESGFEGQVDEFGQPTLNTLHKQLHPYFELGTVYTMIAGLLNILAVYDAWGGPVFGETPKKKKDEVEPEDEAEPKDAVKANPT